MSTCVRCGLDAEQEETALADDLAGIGLDVAVYAPCILFILFAFDVTRSLLVGLLPPVSVLQWSFPVVLWVSPLVVAGGGLVLAVAASCCGGRSGRAGRGSERCAECAEIR